ncbi:MAG TPA: cation diffusion facilitator family transporter [Candidatus Baltobacteraceae bacterium]|jgi:cobalt-zinc-cadmium efflux system protein
MTLRVAFIATTLVAAIECAGGFLAHSLALLTDSAHVFLDAIALLIALAAMHLASRPATRRQTFGFGRTEILAALLNGGLLFAITVFIVVEAVRRLMNPVIPEGPLMAAFAAFALIVNAALSIVLARKMHENLNMRAATLHVLGDALSSFGVILGALVIWRFGWSWIDPLLSIGIAAVIVVGVVRIVLEASDVLLESVPAHVNVERVQDRIRRVDGIVGVHDLHVWTLGTGNYALSAHILLPDRSISDATQILQSVDRAMRDEFAISHVTVQFECQSCAADERIVCTQLQPK